MPATGAVALQFSLHGFTRRAIQILAHPIKNTVHKATRLSAAIRLRQLDRFVNRDHGWDVIAIKHLVYRQPQNVAVHGRDTPKFVIFAVASDSFINIRQMRHHSVDEWLRKFTYSWGSRAKFPEIISLFRSLSPLEIAPEMILNCGFSRFATSTHIS